MKFLKLIIERVPQHVLIPLLFVTLYGSGFVGAKLGLPYAQPLTFLTWRFAFVCAVLTVIAILFRSPWPKKILQIFHMMIAGLLLLGTFSIGVFVAINLGISPAVSALIIALQPILVAIGAGPILGEKVVFRQWLGLFLGLIGVGLVVSQKLTLNHAHFVGILMAIVGLIGLTAGNLYQKRFCSNMNILTGGIIQSFAAGVAALIGALIFESMKVVWSGQFIFALGWMSLVVSIGALSLLYVLIRQGEISQVASIFYLVPVSTAIISFFLYGETIDSFGIIGIVITGCGIILVGKNKSNSHQISPVEAA